MTAYPYYLATVVRRHRLTPRMIRIGLGGSDFVGFARRAPDQYIKLQFPAAGHTNPDRPGARRHRVLVSTLSCTARRRPTDHAHLPHPPVPVCRLSGPDALSAPWGRLPVVLAAAPRRTVDHPRPEPSLPAA
ncbi:MAG: siderophore-interacting protein [Pseudonocardiaceae bacterium]